MLRTDQLGRSYQIGYRICRLHLLPSPGADAARALTRLYADADQKIPAAGG
jgi:hypothetical protein